MTSEHPTLRWEEMFGRTEPATVARHLLNDDRPAHDHDFMELVVILNGDGIHSSASGELPLNKGVALLLRPGTWHAYLRCRELEVVNFCFPLSLTRAEWRHLLDSQVRSALRSGDKLQVTQLSEAATEALDQMERVPRHSTGAVGLIVWALDQFASTLVAGTQLLHPAVEKAVGELEDDPAQPWTATTLAQKVGLDKAYLSRLFKAQVGIGPMGYLAIIRAERAASLLRSSEMNCGEVGLAVGYPDAKLFSRRFRARFGLSPSAYRARTRR